MTEAVCYLLVVSGLLVLGFNGALIVHTAKIVHAVLAWRLFILGKSGLTVYVILSLWDHRHGELSWRVPLAGFAMLLTLVSIIMLDHAYRLRIPSDPPAARA